MSTTATMSEPDRMVGFRPLNINVDPSTHHRFKIVAAREGQSMTAIARRLIRDYIADHEVAGEPMAGDQA